MRGFPSLGGCVLVLLALGGCAEEDQTTVLGTPCEAAGDLGPTSDGLCETAFCTEGVACSSVVEVSQDADLPGALAGAAPGTCVALAPGSYGTVDLPAGVSLLGKGVAFVHVDGLTMAAGSGAVVRGVGVGSSGVVLNGAQAARLEQVCVAGSESNGIELAGGASVTVVSSEVQGSGVYGIKAFASGEVNVARTRIVGSGGPGLWAQCTASDAAAACDCTSSPSVSLDRVEVTGSALVGVSLVGVTATVGDLAVLDTAPYGFEGGGGLSVACSELHGDGVRVEGTESFGVLLASSNGALGSTDEDRGIVIVGGHPGMWLMDISAGLRLENAAMSGSLGVGLGVSGDSKGIVIVGGRVDDTRSSLEALVDGGAESVGDGLSWSDAAQLSVDGLVLANNARQSVLIDGPVAEGSQLLNLDLQGADASSGILQQNADTGAASPSLGAGQQSFSKNAGQLIGVAAPPASPVGL